MKNPALSIIVIFHDMRREAKRTLYTLSTAYQSNVCDTEYKIIAIDNGSNYPLSKDCVRKFGHNFKYHFFETESKSPGSAVNFGANIASTEFIAVVVDGARMVTPGVVDASLRALQAVEDPFVCTLAWHLGPDVQNVSMCDGYNEVAEDQLLESIDWRDNGYRLFEIATIAQSSRVRIPGGMPSECSWFAMRRRTFIELGGFDERFQSPGGGLINHDFLKRALSRSASNPSVILSEGSFHQIHGGVATNVPIAEHPITAFLEEYQIIHGRPYVQELSPDPHYLGDLPPAAKRFFDESAQ